MNAKDQLKILDKNFIIIRERETGGDNNKHIIVYKTKEKPEWHYLDKVFITKSSRLKYINKFLQSSWVVMD